MRNYLILLSLCQQVIWSTNRVEYGINATITRNYLYMDASIFKSYDVRGIYPAQINEDAAYATGCAFAQYLQAKTIAVGRDMRSSSDELFDALTKGITDSGANVIDLGVVTTPMTYFASTILPIDGAVMITASHNPAQYNGMKFCKKNAEPIGLDSGLADVRDLALAGSFQKSERPGEMSSYDVVSAFHQKILGSAPYIDMQLNVVIDCANAMGIAELPLYQRMDNVTVSTLYSDYDSSFPNHEANPIKSETLQALSKKVLDTKADLGIAYDGDADRIGFIDEKGQPLSGDLILALIAKSLLSEKQNETVLYDLRSSKAIKEVIEETGNNALECRVGHAHIKRQMLEQNAIVAGEMSMHYYFREYAFAENPTYAALLVMNEMQKQRKPLSELIGELIRYHHSGELNFEVSDANAVLEKIKQTYKDGTLSELDGIKITYPTWWFSLRQSNTEPLIRLNMEADTKEMLEEKKAELVALISS